MHVFVLSVICGAAFAVTVARAGQASLVIPVDTPARSPSAAPKEVAKPLIDEATLWSALRELPAAYDLPGHTGTGEDAARFARACARLKVRLHLPEGAVEQELPKLAQHIVDQPASPPQDQALAWFALRQFAKAEALARQAAGPAPLPTAPKAKEAGQALLLAGRSAAQEGLFDRALEAYRGAAALLGEQREAAARLDIQRDVALIYTATGRLEEAEKLWRQLMAARLASEPPHHPDVLATQQGLAGLLVKRGRYAEAAAIYRDELTVLEQMQNADAAEIRMVRQNYIRALQSQATSREGPK